MSSKFKFFTFFVLVLVIGYWSLAASPSPVSAYHETLPTHTPIPQNTSPTSILLSPTETPATSSPSPTVDLNNRKTLVAIFGLFAVGGLVLFLTRPK